MFSHSAGSLLSDVYAKRLGQLPGPLGKVSGRVQNWLALRGVVPASSRPVWPGQGALVHPRDAEETEVVLNWAKQYLSKPHPQLGRKGAVCPFVPKSLREERFAVTIRREVITPDVAQVDQLLLAHVHGFVERHPAETSTFDSLLLTFTALPEEHGHVVDTVHTRQKSRLMDRGIMLSQFHPRCEKGAVYNAAFRAYQSPYPCIVMRHMGLHDIIFLSHNAAGFGTYKRLFGHKYAAGSVSNEHGYLDLYRAAEARFGAGKR